MQKQIERNAMLTYLYALFMLIMVIAAAGNLAILVYEAMAYLFKWESYFDWVRTLWVTFVLVLIADVTKGIMDAQNEEKQGD